MHRLALGVVVATWLGAIAPVQAGLYQTFDPVPSPAVAKDGVELVPFSLFRRMMRELPQIQVDPLPGSGVAKTVAEGAVFGGLIHAVGPKSARENYLKLRDELIAKEKTGRATEEDLVNLSAYLMRLGEPNRAVEVLTPRAGRDCRNFMLLANLATANYLAGPGEPGRLTRALDILDQAFAVWPKEWKGLSAEQLDFYRRAETTFRDLLRARRRELARPPEERGGLDPLFGPRDQPVRFVGESGAYEAGKLAAAEAEKLPKDAVALVQQLLVWLPHDTRLYWLYGELLNAKGEVRDASEVFKDCVDLRRSNAKDLLEHRHVVNSAVEAAAAEAQKIGWLPERRQLYVVGGLAALLIAALVYFQVRELRRRHHAAGKG